MSKTGRRIVVTIVLLAGLLGGGLWVLFRYLAAPPKSLALEADEGRVAVILERAEGTLSPKPYAEPSQPLFRQHGILLLDAAGIQPGRIGETVPLRELGSQYSEDDSNVRILGQPVRLAGSGRDLALVQPSSIIVWFRDEPIEQELNDFRLQYGLGEDELKARSLKGLFHFAAEGRHETAEILALVRQIARDPRVRFVDPDVYFEVEPHAQDPISTASSCPPGWELDSSFPADPDIDLGQALAILERFREQQGELDPAVLAVIDSGFNDAHVAFRPAGRVVGLFNPDSGNNNVSNIFGPQGDLHGMQVAGLAAASWEEKNFFGVCPQCHLLLVTRPYMLSKLLDMFDDLLDVAEKGGADIIFGSWGLPPGDAAPSLVKAVAEVASRIPVFWATGNECRVVDFPANVQGVVGVGASDADGEAWCYTNYAGGLDFLAPGGAFGDVCRSLAPSHVDNECKVVTLGVKEEFPFNNTTASFTTFGGTSGAAPIVAGIAGLMLTMKKDLDRKTVIEILEQASVAVDARKCSRGGEIYEIPASRRVNARRALELVCERLPPGSCGP